jgi:hypothetical protein
MMQVWQCKKDLLLSVLATSSESAVQRIEKAPGSLKLNDSGA